MNREQTDGERVTITSDLSFTYMGQTAADECMEHLVRAAISLVSVTIGRRVEEERNACLAHARQSLAWLAIADLADLDRTARWIAHTRLDASINVLDTWRLVHKDHPFWSRLDTATERLITIELRLYNARDDALRRNAQGRLSDSDLERQLRQFDREDQDEGDWRRPPTKEMLRELLERFRAAAEALASAS